MTIGAILARKSGEVVTVRPSATIADAVRLLEERRIGALPVLDGETLLGVFSERDVIHCLAEHGPAALEAPVSSGMTAPAISVARDTPVLAALSLMTQRRIRHLPVLEADRVVGFVSIGDLVKYRMDRIEQEASAMRDYIVSG